MEVGEEAEGTHHGGHVPPALGGGTPAVPGEGEVGEVDGKMEDSGLEGA